MATLNELMYEVMYAASGRTDDATLNELIEGYEGGVFTATQSALDYLESRGFTTGSYNERAYAYFLAGGVPNVENLIINSRFVGVSGDITSGNFVPPTDWSLGFWPPTDAIAYNADAENDGIKFISVNNRGYISQDIDVSAYIGQQISLSVHIDAAIQVSNNRIMHISSGATQNVRIPNFPVGFEGRVYGIYTVTDPNITVRFGSGTTTSVTENISASRPAITVGLDEKVYVPTDPRIT